ncbi:CsgG/HfaB family protein [Novosphingobium sp.]|uniref:CsgG/HfaB family protein n=1 Tax=Novosphingobium sp. TaxID=1874826 RepID=UPI00260FCD66|nr:CsgG/HfaB family protein [Novosphingobium sp.]
MKVIYLESGTRMASRVGAAVGLALALSACSTMMGPGVDTQRLGKGEVPTPIGPAVRDNRTPMEAALACFGDQLVAKGGGRPVIAVGDVKDYTGKYSINEGNAITQGGSLMVYSALGKIGGALAIAERFDPVIAERELGYTDRRQLGDGNVYEVNGNRVPWVPYFGGSITKSDYYIVGGITELNYNIRSGGAEITVNNMGPKARVYTQSIGIDLRIVDSRSLVVIKTVSLTKQFSGYEVGANVFRFFGTDLFDINIGAKGQEPLQLGIRTALEEATMRLVAATQRVDPSACMTQRIDTIPDLPAEQLRGRALANGGVPAGPAPVAPMAAPLAPAPAVAAPANAQSLNGMTSGAAAPSGKLLQIGFEFGDTMLMGTAQSVLDQIVALASSSGIIDVMLVARDTENWDPAKRDALIDQRLAVVTTALANRGIAPSAITVVWRPDRADTSVHRDGPGLQEIAKIQIRK